MLRDLSRNGQFFASKDNIALSLNMDGVPLYKSSSWSLWPVFLTILNLPISIRMKAENVLLAGLWYGPTKPPMKLLLQPVLNRLKQLATSGLTIRTPEGLRRIRTKVVMGIFQLKQQCCVQSSSMVSMAVLCVSTLENVSEMELVSISHTSTVNEHTIAYLQQPRLHNYTAMLWKE